MAGDGKSGYLYIYSNDGQTELAKIQRYLTGVNPPSTITISSTGITWAHGVASNTYTYSGTKIFLGVATSPNATTPNYKVGDTVTWDGSDWEENVNWHIVEEKPKSIKTFDLSTLNLSAGTHEVTVKARASGYVDSPASNVVSYVVAVQQTIVFTIDGTTYYAEEGMTWGEWVESEYNTGGFYVSTDGKYIENGEITTSENGEPMNKRLKIQASTAESITTSIQNGQIYVMGNDYHGGGGND